MVALKLERKALLLQVNKTNIPKSVVDNTVKDLGELCSILENLFVQKKHCIELSDSGALPPLSNVKILDASKVSKITTSVIYISDFLYDTTAKKCQILFTRADASVSNPAFIHAGNNKVRIEKPQPGEAVGFSAHMTISTKESHKSFGGYRAVLEKVPNLSRSLIFGYLERLLQVYSRKQGLFYTLTSDKKETRAYRVAFSAFSKPSSNLTQDIKEGNVSMIELIDNNVEYAGIDKESRVKKVSKKVQIKVDFPKNSGSFMDFFKKTAEQAKIDGFDEVLVRIQNLPGNRSSSPRFALEMEDAADMLYSRIEILDGFSTPLEQCYAKHCPAINSKLDEKLTDEKIWK